MMRINRDANNITCGLRRDLSVQILLQNACILRVIHR